MFEKWKKLFRKEALPLPSETMSPVIITIHGYGRRRRHEFDNFALWGKNGGFDIVQFDMYDIFDETDHEWKTWISRACDVMKSYENSGRDIILVGFSMGGVIASYLASCFHVKKLILLAPAFQYMNMDNITGMISKSAASLLSNEKKEKEEIILPRSFYGTFTDVVKNLKKYICEVPCPVLILHGDEDEVISVKSSVFAYEKIPHENKKMIILHGGHHRLLMDEKVHWECYQIMKLFLEDRILAQDVIPQAPDILDDLEKMKAEIFGQ